MPALNRRTDLGKRDFLSRSVRLALQQQARNSGVSRRVSGWGIHKTASFTFITGDKFVIEATGASATIDLPATIADGDEFILHNATTSTEVVQIDPNGHSIVGAGGTVTSSDTLVLALGDTAHLVAISSSVVEVV